MELRLVLNLRFSGRARATSHHLSCGPTRYQPHTRLTRYQPHTPAMRCQPHKPTMKRHSSQFQLRHFDRTSVTRAERNEVVLAVLEHPDAKERTLLVLKRGCSATDPDAAVKESQTVVELRQQSYGPGVGWFTQSSVTLLPSQVAQLRAVLGTVPQGSGSNRRILSTTLGKTNPRTRSQESCEPDADRPCWNVVRCESA
jgi:hypothetical protein